MNISLPPGERDNLFVTRFFAVTFGLRRIKMLTCTRCKGRDFPDVVQGGQGFWEQQQGRGGGCAVMGIGCRGLAELEVYTEFPM